MRFTITTSGASQYGVPMNDLRLSLGQLICADTPKSAVRFSELALLEARKRAAPHSA